ncbi:MAG: EndoU domain-containing protein [Ruminococcus sp.]|nr:EndoU domain-containing protein [Ruminococcus sp.]
MKNPNRLIAVILSAVLLMFTASCNVQVQEIVQSTEPRAVSSPQNTENVQPTQTTAEPAKASYTMADIKQLKNTEHFARKTLEHIFDGTINSKGKATGYHYTKVSDSKGKVIDGTRSSVDENGVFTGKVEVSGVKKNGFSSFYPESWTPQQVVDAINTAYDDAINDPSNPKGELWIGYCGDLEIDMYLDSNKKITTAFPIYEGD